jgi:pyridoxine/pyridoxamine 5'-phosphate oxidase
MQHADTTRGKYDAGLVGQDHGLGPVAQAELGQQVAHVAYRRIRAHRVTRPERVRSGGNRAAAHANGRETGRMDVTDLDADPLRQISAWLDEARTAGQPMPDAMTIASATSDGVPSARLVVLRGLQRGLVFFTDRESDKGAELAANPQAAAVLHWLVPAHRQVRAAGPVEQVSQDEADEYWNARAPAVRLSAAASRQSRVVASRREGDGWITERLSP